MSTISSSTTSTTAYKVTADTTGALVIQTGATPTTAVTIDTSQNVGIGTASPNSKMSIAYSSTSTSVLGTYANIPLLLQNTSSTDNNWSVIGVQDASGDFSSYIGTQNTSQASNTAIMAFATNGGTGATERMRIDSSGNVGIGNSSPLARLDLGGSTGVKFLNYNGGAGGAQSGFGTDLSGTSYELSMFSGGGSAGLGVLSFGQRNSSTAAYTERMRIDSSGRLGVGTTPYAWASGWTPIDLANSASIVSTGDGNLVSTGNCYYNGSAWIRKIAGYAALTETNSGNSGTIKTYTAGSSTAGSSITLTAGPYVANLGTSWTNSSDERLKDIIEPITDATNKVSQLRAVIGKFKTDPDDKRRSFLIAQDVQTVLPEAVDATDPDSLGVQYTDVIPLLVAAIKEQQALITQLQADVAALKGATP
jgi:hypothetical protein